MAVPSVNAVTATNNNSSSLSSRSNVRSNRSTQQQQQHTLQEAPAPAAQQSSQTCRRADHRRRRRHIRRPAGSKVLKNKSPMERSILKLEETLDGYGCYDTADDDARRRAIVDLEKLLARWTTISSTTFGSNNSNINNNNDDGCDGDDNDGDGTPCISSGGKSSSKSKKKNAGNCWTRPRVALITFGSYRLGVSCSNSDIDVLALCPPACTRNDFFTSLVKILKEDGKCSKVHPIRTAYTPVIKFVLSGLHVDLLFARVSNPAKLLEYQRKRPSLLLGPETVQQQPMNMRPARLEYLIDDSDLQYQDEAGLRSLNGARVSQILLESVPCLKSYRTVLQAVKLWAVNAGIYSNVLGFLGGVNWAILVAWVAIRNPEASPTFMLEVFFRTFSDWKWPNPIMLTSIQDTPPVPGIVHCQAWNPATNPRDGLHIMPIITPAYPSMNSSYNVGIPQLRRIQDEMLRACQVLKEKREEDDYSALFAQPSDFFKRHAHFLQVTIRAVAHQNFIEWFRLCESKLRLLIASLETPEVHAWPLGRFFDRRYNSTGVVAKDSSRKVDDAEDSADYLHESCFFIGLRFAPELDMVNLRHQISDFLHKVNSWGGRKAGMDLSLNHVTADKIPAFVLEQMNETNRRSSSKQLSSNNSNTSTASHHDDTSITCSGSEFGSEKPLSQEDDQSTASSSYASSIPGSILGPEAETGSIQVGLLPAPSLDHRL